jgi:hypothetical protein
MATYRRITVTVLGPIKGLSRMVTLNPKNIDTVSRPALPEVKWGLSLYKTEVHFSGSRVFEGYLAKEDLEWLESAVGLFRD